MKIRQELRPGRNGSDGRIEVDWRIPGAGLMGRKVYLVAEDRPRRMLRPHRHLTPHLLVCMAGRALLAYREIEQSVMLLEMFPGHTYHIPSALPHQLLMEPGTTLAAYFPTMTWVNREERIHELNEDWIP